MELTLHTETTFDSAHFLKGYDGKCSNIHGHSWKVEVWFKGDSTLKDKVGILVDFSIMKQIKDILDHKLLNDITTVNPTAENLTELIYYACREEIMNNDIKVKVRVYESMIDKVTYCEGGDW